MIVNLYEMFTFIIHFVCQGVRLNPCLTLGLHCSLTRDGRICLVYFFFFFMNENTERAQCALSQVCIP